MRKSFCDMVRVIEKILGVVPEDHPLPHHVREAFHSYNNEIAKFHGSINRHMRTMQAAEQALEALRERHDEAS